jgi:hypothetical protein
VVRVYKCVRVCLCVSSVKLLALHNIHPQHIICCGEHGHMLWTHVTHNIQTPTTYTMDRRRPQHIPTTYERYPQHIVTHNRYVHNIHPQHKIRCPQPMSVMDTRTTYQMLSTTYLTKNPFSPQHMVSLLWTTCYMLWIYVVDNTLGLCCGWICCGPHRKYMLWVTRHVTHNICQMLSTTCTCYPQHVIHKVYGYVVDDMYMLWTTLQTYVVGYVVCHPQHM